jgi:3-oxoacyl-[acyl-carrier protein] reductase
MERKGQDAMTTTTSAEERIKRGNDLSGRVALVTGGTRGIGAAIAESLAGQGAAVAAGYSSNRDAAQAVLEGLNRNGGSASIHQGNVGDPEDCERVVNEVIDQHGRLDILVNNAGVTADRPLQKMTVEDWHKVLRVNLSGAFYMCKPVVEHMLERGSGRIINISSVIGETGRIGQLNYASSKSGLFGFTKTLAQETAFALARAGKLEEDAIAVTVNAVTPGLINTDMTAGMPEKMLAQLKEEIPMRRLGEPEEVARVVCFLAADASRYITGQVWGVNGGYDM